MRKIIILSVFTAIVLSPQLPAETVRFGAFLDYFMPSDPVIKDVYDEAGDLLYGGRINVMVFKGIQIAATYGQFKKFGTTTELNDITRMTLTPLTIGIRYSPPLGRLTPFIEAAFLKLSFKEESDIGNASGNLNGYMLMGGLEFLLSERFGVSLEIKTQDAEGPIGSTGIPISFKGISGGLGFFVRI